MSTFLVVFIISSGLLTFFLLLTFFYYQQIQKMQMTEELEKKEKSLDIILEKYALKEKKNVMLEKLAQITQIIAETESEIAEKTSQRTKLAEESFKERSSEVEIIQQADVKYRTFAKGLSSAMPISEEERQRDLKDLKNVMEILESLEETKYLKDQKTVDVARGLFFDKMSQKINSIINELNLRDHKIIPNDRLIFHSLKSIHQLKNEDFDSIFNIMKETGFFNDFIEINPELSLIVFKREKLSFNQSEKVLLAFAYAEDYLTPQKLMELTEWNNYFAMKVINSLKEKELLTIYDENIKIDGFGNVDERKKWNEFIENQIKQEKEDFERKRGRQKEREDEFKEKMRLKQQKLKKIEDQRLKDIDDLKVTIEKLEEIAYFDTKPSSQEITREQISEKILEYYEQNLILNGGLVQFAKIYDHIKEDYPKIIVKKILDVLHKFQEMQMIKDSFMLGRGRIYLFQEMELDDKDKEFLLFTINKKPMTKEEFLKGLKWDEENLLKIMKKLQGYNILRIEKNKIVIPGIKQTEVIDEK